MKIIIIIHTYALYAGQILIYTEKNMFLIKQAKYLFAEFLTFIFQITLLIHIFTQIQSLFFREFCQS